MKRILLLLLALPLAFPAMAQDYAGPARFEIDLFAGSVPTSALRYHHRDFLPKYQPETYPNGSLARIYEPAPVKVNSTEFRACPYVGLRLGYGIYRWLKVGADLGWDYYTETRTFSDKTVESGGLHTITVIPKLTFYFATSRYVSAYAGFGMGVAVHVATGAVDPEVYHPVWYAWQVTPIGITVGRKVPGFAELTFGEDMIGIKVGVGYRF